MIAGVRHEGTSASNCTVPNLSSQRPIGRVQRFFHPENVSGVVPLVIGAAIGAHMSLEHVEHFSRLD